MNKYARPASFFDLINYLNIRGLYLVFNDFWARSSAWLEHWSYTPSVGGSNPPVPIKLFRKKFYQKGKLFFEKFV